jgi:hypothetical protein
MDSLSGSMEMRECPPHWVQRRIEYVNTLAT